MIESPERINGFLIANGYKAIDDGGDYISYYKKNSCAVDVCKEKSSIVLVNEWGDIAEIHYSLYALIGFLIDKRQIAADYKPWNYKGE